MRRLIVALCVASAVGVVAQEGPSFEVASVRQNTSNDGPQFIRMLPGHRLSATNMPVRALIILSYQRAHYDITANLFFGRTRRRFTLGSVAALSGLATTTLAASQMKLSFITGERQRLRVL